MLVSGLKPVCSTVQSLVSIEPVLLKIRRTLDAPQAPEAGGDCEYCVFFGKATGA